jgi:hypothetical protein
MCWERDFFMVKGSEAESSIIIDWGDGTLIKVKKPNLGAIPGPSVVCPWPCDLSAYDDEDTGEVKEDKI